MKTFNQPVLKLLKTLISFRGFWIR